MTKTVVIVGATGMLGSMFAKRARAAGLNIHEPSSGQLDITRASSVHAYFARISPQFILNCAASKQFDSDIAVDVGFSVNVLGPILLRDASRQCGAHLIHISTDAVFGARAGGPFNEEHAPAPGTHYERSKLLGEIGGALVIRGSFVGPGQTRRPSLVERLMKGASVAAGIGELWNGLTSLEVASLLIDYMLTDRMIIGIRHIYGPDITRLELVEAIITHLAPNGTVIKSDRSADRRLASVYSDLQSDAPTADLHQRIAALRHYTGHM